MRSGKQGSGGGQRDEQQPSPVNMSTATSSFVIYEMGHYQVTSIHPTVSLFSSPLAVPLLSAVSHIICQTLVLSQPPKSSSLPYLLIFLSQSQLDNLSSLCGPDILHIQICDNISIPSRHPWTPLQANPIHTAKYITAYQKSITQNKIKI